jgi:hypothetical protein
MTVLWAVPVLALVLGTVTLTVLVRGAADEARALMAQVSGGGELHVALSGVSDGLVETRRIIGDLRPK